LRKSSPLRAEFPQVPTPGSPPRRGENIGIRLALSQVMTLTIHSGRCTDCGGQIGRLRRFLLPRAMRCAPCELAFEANPGGSLPPTPPTPPTEPSSKGYSDRVA
jgi:hypothetical protein